MTAEERAWQMMETKMSELPPLALDYAKYLGNKYGACMEVFMTAYAHFAQAVEQKISKDDLYTIDQEGIAWFGSRLTQLAPDEKRAAAKSDSESKPAVSSG